MAAGDTLWNALLGALVTGVLAWFVPFAPLFGGGVAGYLEGGDRSDGIRVGVVSGFIAFTVGTLISATFAYAILSVLPPMGVPGMPSIFGAFFLFVASMWFVYIVGLSTLGGWLGNYVRREGDVDLDT